MEPERARLPEQEHLSTHVRKEPMSDPREHKPEDDDLQLDAETVRDLEPSADDAEDVRGGLSLQCCTAVDFMTCIKPK
jgi:hypothetical protein